MIAVITASACAEHEPPQELWDSHGRLRTVQPDTCSAGVCVVVPGLLGCLDGSLGACDTP